MLLFCCLFDWKKGTAWSDCRWESAPESATFFSRVTKIIPNWFFVFFCFFQSRYSPHPAFILQAVTMPTGVIIIIATMRNVKNKSKPQKKLDFQTKQKSNGIKVLCWACNINLVLLVKSVYIVTAGAIDTVVTLSFFKKTFTITIWYKSWKILNKTQGLSESVICWASTAVAQRTKRLMTLGVLPCVAPAAAELDGRMLTESHWTVEAWLFFFPIQQHTVCCSFRIV